MSGDTSADRIENLIQIASLGALNLGQPARDASHAIPEPELRLPQHAIVGRSELVAAVLAGIEAGQQDFAFEFLPGIGKTTVAAELIRHQALRGRFDGVLWAHLGQAPDVHGELVKWAEAVGLDEAAIAKRKNDGELGRAIAARIGERHVLLVVDDVWTSAEGQYFMLAGPHITRVLTSRKRGVARDLNPRAQVHVVPKLALDDSLRLLRALAPQAAEAEADALRMLADRVDGLPLALVLLGRMLRNNEDESRPVQDLLASLSDIRRMFAAKKPMEFAENASFSLAEVVEAGYSQLGSSGLLNGEPTDAQQLREAVTALAVLRPDPIWFDESLALSVAEVRPVLLRQLVQAGMLERRAAARPGGEPRYTMHRVIAEYLRSKLPTERLQLLNTRAAYYYLAQLKAIEEQYQKRSHYLGLYRYENPDWRESQDNWLYHFAQAGYSRDATMAFLRVWLTAFWWWSCFTDEGFDFCDQLLNEWAHRLSLSAPEAGSGALLQAQSGERINQLLEGLDLLRRFKLAYPKETVERSQGFWPDVEATLGEIRRRAQLDAAPPDGDKPDACVVRGLTSVFLAEAARFGRQDFSAAETRYRDALALFVEIGDEWTQAWVLYHLADMQIQRGQPALARPLCEQALRLAEPEQDPEVVALLQRALGDVELRGGELDAARQHYAQALQAAYLFQVSPEPPDAYTVSFYPELAEAVAERLLVLQASEPAAAQALARDLRRPWLRAQGLPESAEPVEIAGSTAAALAARLFAPALPLEQLGAEGAAYAQRVIEHLSRMQQTAADE